MASSEPSLLPIERAARKPRKCGACGQVGHDRRNCGTVVAVPTVTDHPTPPTGVVPQNAVQTGGSPAPMFITMPHDPALIDWERVLSVVFDLETTGRMRNRDEIIELAAAILDPSGIHIEDANFAEFIRPSIPRIPANITAITQITDNMVKDAEPFTTVAEAFINFMQQQADTYSAAKGFPVEHLILVGHYQRFRRKENIVHT